MREFSFTPEPPQANIPHFTIEQRLPDISNAVSHPMDVFVYPNQNGLPDTLESMLDREAQLLKAAKRARKPVVAYQPEPGGECVVLINPFGFDNTPNIRITRTRQNGKIEPIGEYDGQLTAQLQHPYNRQQDFMGWLRYTMVPADNALQQVMVSGRETNGHSIQNVTYVIEQSRGMPIHEIQAILDARTNGQHTQ